MMRLWIRLCLWLAGKLLHRYGYRVVRSQPFAAMVEEQLAAINYLQVSGALATYHARRKMFHGMDRVLDAMDAAVNLSPTPTMPLTDAELTELDATLLRRYDDASRIVNGHRAAAEIRALRAERDNLLAELKGVAATLQVWADVFAEKELTSVSGLMDKRLTQVRAIIVRAEGRGE